MISNKKLTDHYPTLERQLHYNRGANLSNFGQNRREIDCLDVCSKDSLPKSSFCTDDWAA